MLDRFALLLANPSGVTVAPLAGDASGRRYARWSHPSFRPMIHMDARNDRPDGVADFQKIATHLRSLGISAPEILAQSRNELLLEDLGDNIYATILGQSPELEEQLYLSAADVLIEIQKVAAPGSVPVLGPELMTEAISPAFESYLFGATGNSQLDIKHAMASVLKSLLQQTYPDSPKLLLRDYHAENLIWLPDRDGIAQTGVLDFQDAHVGHQAYDLASLLEDARRDVSEETREAVLTRFIAKSNQSHDDFMYGFCVQAAQRNLRILGILAGLSYNSGKRRYLKFIPRVWKHLQRDLEHPNLQELRDLINEAFPAPDRNILRRLEGPDA